MTPVIGVNKCNNKTKKINLAIMIYSIHDSKEQKSVPKSSFEVFEKFTSMCIVIENCLV